MRERAMSDKTCEECIQKCKLLHGNSPHEVISFFKVMFGDDFSKVLFLPPKCARRVTDLVGKKFQFEDVNKQIWTVMLTIVKGSLAFQKGWNVFSKDHNLKIGDLLVFELKQPSHFLIKVFDRSGCPKLIFSENNSKKRKRVNAHQAHTTDSVSSDMRNSGMNETNVIISVDRNTVAASGTKFSEESIFMLNRDAVGHNNEDVGQRISLFDLSSFEQQQAKKDAITVRPCSKEFVSANEQQAKKDAINVRPCSKEFAAAKTSRLIGDNADNAAIPAIVNCLKKLGECNKTPSIDTLRGNALTCKEDPVQAIGDNAAIPTIVNCLKKLEECNKTPSIDTLRGNALTRKEDPVQAIGNNADNAAIPAIVNCLKKLEECNKTPSITRKEEPVQAIGNNIVIGENKNDEVFMVPVKREPEPESSSRKLEEPPTSEMPAEEEGKQIYLRGFDNILWPVFYKSTDTMGNGWNKFKEANNIGAEEVYVFKSENNSDIYSVCRTV